jgi:TrmH family RNA methyltransferase
MPLISSLHNARVKQIRALKLRKERERTGCFFIEGRQALIAAVRAGVQLETLVLAPELLAGRCEQTLLELQLQSQVDRLEVSADVFRTLAARDNAHGIAAVVRQRWHALARVQPTAGVCWVALDSIQYPGNLGTILRTCDATGTEGVILLGATSDPYDPESVRASVGAIFSLRLVRASAAEFIAWKYARRVSVVGTSPAATLDYRMASYALPVVLLMGGERSGLPPSLQSLCDAVVQIPMVGQSDSLNLAVATSLMLYEVFRQRRGYDVHPGVAQVSRSPDCSPSFSAIWRCSDEPCVHDSGET